MVAAGVLLAACSAEPAAQRSTLTSTGGLQGGSGRNGSATDDTADASLALEELSTAALSQQIISVPGLSADASKPAATGLGPWITVREGGAAGYADLGRATLTDLSGDGHAEAVVGLVAGAGQPGTGLVVLGPGEGAPRLVGDSAFYASFGFAARGTVESGELVVRHNVGAGWEPPCCYSGEVTRRYRVVEDRLIETSPAFEVGNLVAKGFTVDHFYALINARNYEGAYALMTTVERERTKASLWPTIWSGGSQISVNILSTPRADGLFPFRLLIAGDDGGVQAWQGGVGLVYNPKLHSWLIDLLSLQPENL